MYHSMQMRKQPEAKRKLFAFGRSSCWLGRVVVYHWYYVARVWYRIVIVIVMVKGLSVCRELPHSRTTERIAE